MAVARIVSLHSFLLEAGSDVASDAGSNAGSMARVLMRVLMRVLLRVLAFSQVTGSNKGIGAEIVRQLTSQGVTAVLTGRNESLAQVRPEP